jgi:hypothetical protein
MAMKVRDLIARLVALRDADLLDDFGRELATSLEWQARRGQGPTERQRCAALALLKERDPAVAAAAVASVRDHVLALTPEAVERVHRDGRGREIDDS